MSAIARMTTGATDVWRWIATMPLRIKLAKREVAAAQEAPAGPSVRERQADLIQFYGHFEHLVETLCDAAQYGPVEKLERRYRQEREWMQTHYVKVRKYVVAYLRFEVGDAEQSSLLDGTYGDAFESLFAAPDLQSFLNVDDGNMISRIMRTRQALNLYGEHLRQLLVREKACA